MQPENRDQLKYQETEKKKTRNSYSSYQFVFIQLLHTSRPNFLQFQGLNIRRWGQFYAVKKRQSTDFCALDLQNVRSGWPASLKARRNISNGAAKEATL